MADVPNTLTLRLCDTAALRRRFKGEKRRLAISRRSRSSRSHLKCATWASNLRLNTPAQRYG